MLVQRWSLGVSKNMDKSIFNFKILYQDGSVIDLHEDKNIWVSSFHISSPAPEHSTETIEGRHGSIYLGTTLKERIIPVSFTVEAMDPIEFDLLRDDLFLIFNPLQKFHIIRDLQPEKRMEVSVASSFDIDYLSLEDGKFDIDFIIHSTFLESVGTTLETPIAQITGGRMKKYRHSTSLFEIYNGGIEPIDPRKYPLVIEYKGSSSNLKIKNQTTGDEWTYSGTSNPIDSIKLEGIRSTKNGLSIFKDTNRKIITLATGWNTFQLSGTTDPFEILFDFRFYTI
jgi:phage-related protein